MKPAKADFRKTNGRFQPVALTDDEASVAVQQRLPRRRVRVVLPVIVILVVVVYLDRSGTFAFWPQGTLQNRITPYLPTVVQKVLPPIGSNAQAAVPGEGPVPGGPLAPVGAGNPTTGRRGLQSIPVLAAAAHFEDVPVIATAVGTVQALATVTVRTQVDGPLLELTFNDGQDVKKGDVLARIDARTYQAQYDQAVAKKAQDESVLANARIDLVRYDRLATTDYGTKQQADTQRALVTQYEAQVRSDQGAIDNTKAMLDNCTIRSPLDGRTGIRAVDQGNVIHAADTNGIVVITQIHPITVIFNVPQQQLKSVFAAFSRGPVPTDALEADDTTIIEHGQIDVIDNQVDQTTGTIRLKATFPNAHNQLWPGQFVNVHVLVDTLKNATVLPTGAVQRGPNGAYVYVINDDSTVTQTPVSVGRQDEAKAVILAGIAPPTRVVTTGFTRLVDGSKVTVGEGETASPVVTVQPKRRQSQNQASDEPHPRDPASSGQPRDPTKRREGQYRRNAPPGDATNGPASNSERPNDPNTDPSKTQVPVPPASPTTPPSPPK